jgi:dihydrolipoamide dehydrogenase
MAVEEVDLVVIGSGQGGVPLAVDRAKRGERVVLFERGELGGTCVNYGCTPSKAFLASAHNAGRARRAGPLGVHADVTVDQRAVMERVRRVRDEWRDGIGPKLAKAGVEVVHASAAFSAERTVRGGDREVRGKRVVIDTGASPTLPPVHGLADVPYFTNLTFFDQIELPKRLLVIGGGYIGLELGQGAQRLGAAVTIVHGSENVMDREEHDAAAFVRSSMEGDGVVFELHTHAKSVERAGDTLRLTLDNGKTLEGDGILVATGRMPNTADLNVHLSNVNCRHGGFIDVNDYLETSCPGVFALGDVAGQPQFTHVSWEDFRRLTSTFAGKPRRRDDRVLSYTTFTEPQLARTGLTEGDAKAKGIDAGFVTLPLSNVARAAEWDLEAGFYRLVIDRANDKIIGATFVGYEAGELIHVIGFAIELGATWRDLDNFVGIHPTFGEGLPSLARLFES